MKKVSFIVCILFICISISIVFCFNVIYAENDIKLEPILNIDDNKNITVTIKACNINSFEADLEYDSNIISYDGIENTNDWEIVHDEDNPLKISLILPSNSENIEEKDIAVLKFKPVNIENINETDISLVNINIGKDDYNADNINLIVNLLEEDEEAENEEELDTSEDLYISNGEDEEEIQGEQTGDEEQLEGDEEHFMESADDVDQNDSEQENDLIENSVEEGKRNEEEELETGNEDYIDNGKPDFEEAISSEEDQVTKNNIETEQNEENKHDIKTEQSKEVNNTNTAPVETKKNGVEEQQREEPKEDGQKEEQKDEPKEDGKKEEIKNNQEDGKEVEEKNDADEKQENEQEEQKDDVQIKKSKPILFIIAMVLGIITVIITGIYLYKKIKENNKYI